MKVIGFDANDDEIQDLKDGKVNGLIVQNHLAWDMQPLWLQQGLL